MTGHKGSIADQIDAGFLFQDAHRRERDRHQRRLGIFGQSEGFERAAPDGVAQPLAERRVDFLKHLPRRGKGVGQGLAHAHGLAALTWENKRNRHNPETRPSF